MVDWTYYTATCVLIDFKLLTFVDCLFVCTFASCLFTVCPEIILGCLSHLLIHSILNIINLTSR